MATDTRNLSIGTDGDLDMVAGNLVLVGGAESIRQAIGSALRLVLGEWFLDDQMGLPYFTRIFVKNPNIGLLTALYRDAILAVPGVNEVLELSLAQDTAARRLTVTFRVSTDLGELTSSIGAPA